MKTIEDYSQMLDWAERANLCVDLKTRVDLQDEFGRSNANLMKEIFLKAIDKDSRRIILFGVYKIMGDQWLEEYIRIWTQYKAESFREKVLADLEERERRLEIRQQIFENAKKPIYKKIRSLMHQFELQVIKTEQLDLLLKERTKQVQRLRDNNHALIRDAVDHKIKAEKWQTLSNMIKDDIRRMDSEPAL